MSQQFPQSVFLRDSRTNAIVAWTLVVVLVGAAIENLLAGRLVAVAVAITAAVVSIVPAVVEGSWRRTVPWPLLLIASLPLVLSAVRPTFFADVLVGLGVAALAMLVVVTLHLVTTVRMSPKFAVFFVVLATLGVTGFWAVGSALSAEYLGTTFVSTNTQLMLVFTAAAIGGVVAGAVFRWFFRRQLHATESARTEEVGMS